MSQIMSDHFQETQEPLQETQEPLQETQIIDGFQMESDGGDLHDEGDLPQGRDDGDLPEANLRRYGGDQANLYHHEDSDDLEPFYFSSQRALMTIMQKKIFGACVPQDSSSWWLDMHLRRAQDSFFRAHHVLFNPADLHLEWKKLLTSCILELRSFCFYQEAVREHWVPDLPYRECWDHRPVSVFKSTNLASIILDDCRMTMGNLLRPLQILNDNLLIVSVTVTGRSSMADFHLRNAIINYISDLRKCLDEDIIRVRFFPQFSLREDAAIFFQRMDRLAADHHLDH